MTFCLNGLWSLPSIGRLRAGRLRCSSEMACFSSSEVEMPFGLCELNKQGINVLRFEVKKMVINDDISLLLINLVKDTMK